MLDWAAASFNVIGPGFAAKDAETLEEVRVFMTGLSEDAVLSGSWASDLFSAERTGRLQSGEACAAIAAYVIPSLDTTILSKGHLIANLAHAPEQWELLRARAELVPSAVLETMRYSSVVRWFSRYVANDYTVGDHVVPSGARVMLMYGSANRDERRFPDPDKFDVTRDARDHLGWGTGPHLCAGMHLARTEMEVMLEALLEADVKIEIDVPILAFNRGLYGFTDLPCKIER